MEQLIKIFLLYIWHDKNKGACQEEQYQVCWVKWLSHGVIWDDETI